MKRTTNDFTLKFEDNYPFLISTLMEYINEIKQKDERHNLSLIDIIMDFSFRNGLDVELVGDAIRSDIYLKSFIEKDCQLHGIIASKMQTIEDW